MTTQQASADGDPRAELLRSHDLARRVRRSQRATWFPLLVFAVVTFGAVPADRAGHRVRTVCRAVPQAGPDGRVCLAHNSAGFVYWPIALVLAYLVIAAFYLQRSRARGVGSRVRPYVIAGIVIAVIAAAASVWVSHTKPLVGRYDVLGWQLQGPDVYRLIAPACAIGLALFVLAAVERSVALVAFTVGYLTIAVVPIDFGWTVSPASHWGFLPNLIIDGCVLLAGSIGFALAQRGRA